jgi:hypothetical protein
VTEEQIQSLVDHRLLRPKSQVGWRPAVGEAFPAEGTGETVVFIAHIERGFSVRAGDFLRGLLQFYRIKLLHLAFSSIIIIATFIHLCEAYLGISPHFHRWHHLFELKNMGKGVVVGNVRFMLHRNMMSEYIDLALPDNSTGWKQGWFYLDNAAPALRWRMGRCNDPNLRERKSDSLHLRDSPRKRLSRAIPVSSGTNPYNKGIKEELHNIIITTSEYNSSAQAGYKSNRTESRKVKHLRSGSTSIGPALVFPPSSQKL